MLGQPRGHESHRRRRRGPRPHRRALENPDPDRGRRRRRADCRPHACARRLFARRRRTADEWKWGVEFHQALGPVLDDAGITLGVEPLNRFETYFLNTAADAVKFVSEIDHERIGILLDTFHQNIEDKNIADAYRACGDRLLHVHTCENDRGIPGSGHVDWPNVLRAIKDTGYDRWLTIESFNAHIPDLSAATAIWRDLAPSMDDIAIEGTRFLRDLWART